MSKETPSMFSKVIAEFLTFLTFCRMAHYSVPLSNRTVAPQKHFRLL
jgi:hypothetical protein